MGAWGLDIGRVTGAGQNAGLMRRRLKHSPVDSARRTLSPGHSGAKLRYGRQADGRSDWSREHGESR